jgi:hypothetical protein
MPYELLNWEQLCEDRRKSVAKTLRTITPEELKKVADDVFEYMDDPGRELFLGFIAENPGATYHYAVTHDGVHVIYCLAKDKGMWFLPGQGKGPLPELGCLDMKAAIEGPH